MDRERFLDLFIGEEFDLPRGYGHAHYEVVVDWHQQGASRLYFRLENEHPVITDARADSFCIAVRRLGGYDGPPKRSFADVVRELIPLAA